MNFREFLAEKTLDEKSDFYFSLRKIFFCARQLAQGVFSGEMRKRAFFSWADLYVTDIIKMCMKKFDAEKIVFDKLTEFLT